jgi:hypothetical protein
LVQRYGNIAIYGIIASNEEEIRRKVVFGLTLLLEKGQRGDVMTFEKILCKLLNKKCSICDDSAIARVVKNEYPFTDRVFYFCKDHKDEYDNRNKLSWNKRIKYEMKLEIQARSED